MLRRARSYLVDFENKDKLNLPDFPATLIPPLQLPAATRPNNHFEGVSVQSVRARIVTSHVTSPHPAWVTLVVKFQRKIVCEQGLAKSESTVLKNIQHLGKPLRCDESISIRSPLCLLSVLSSAFSPHRLSHSPHALMATSCLSVVVLS